MVALDRGVGVGVNRAWEGGRTAMAAGRSPEVDAELKKLKAVQDGEPLNAAEENL